VLQELDTVTNIKTLVPTAVGQVDLGFPADSPSSSTAFIFPVSGSALIPEEAPVLVLSRKAGQAVLVNDNITLTIVSVKGDTVRIGFTAPPEVLIDRAEVRDRKRGDVKVVPLIP
jgi:carbon storage regulator